MELREIEEANEDGQGPSNEDHLETLNAFEHSLIRSDMQEEIEVYYLKQIVMVWLV